jgi:hypothetical protein
MDPNDFRDVIGQLASSNPEVVQEAQSFLFAMSEGQLPVYLRCHLFHLATAEGDDGTFSLSASLLCRAGKSELLRTDPSISQAAWNLFAEFAPAILANAALTDRVKTIFASALATVYTAISAAFPGDYFTLLTQLLDTIPEFHPFVLS